jgi:putative oxidoreductase
MFGRLNATSSTWVTLPLRLALAAVFIAHGSQKVFGTFGGPGLRAFVSSHPAPFPFMEKGLWLWLGAAAFSELIGGVLLLLGLLTRAAAFFLACTMIVALFAYHAPAFFAPKGFEYPMVLLAACLALLIAGGGVASADIALTGARGRRR